MKRLLSVLLVCAMMLALFEGCGGAVNSAESVASAPEVSEAVPAVSAEEPVPEASADESSEAPVETVESPALPLSDSGEVLTMWLPLTPDLANTYSDMNEHLVVQEAEKRTGVHIDFTSCSFDTASDQFSLMAAAGEYCDPISCAIKYYSTGAAGALEDGIIIDMAEYLEADAPDYYALINSDAQHIAQSRTDGGEVLAFYTWKDEVYNRSGMQCRGDWLEELKLEAPETYEEYENVLLAFRDNYGCQAAIQMYPSCLLTGSMLCGGYGVSGYFTAYDDPSEMPNVMYQVDGTVHCSLLEDGYLDYLTMLNRWYEEGLISKDFLSGSSNPNDASNLGDIYSGNTGIWYSEYQNLTSYANSIDSENAKVIAIKDAVLEKGDVSHFGSSIALGSSNGFTTSVSTDCENTELAVQWCNYWFTLEGSRLASFGIEGESYVVDENGEPVFTELVTNNPDGLSQREAQAMYSLSQFPSLSSKSVDFLSMSQEQIDAIAVWDSSIDGAYVMPDVSLTPEESTEYASLMSDINTYAATMVDKMVVGDEPLENWDDFTATLKEMGMERCTAIYQAAMDRYNQR